MHCQFSAANIQIILTETIESVRESLPRSLSRAVEGRSQAALLYLAIRLNFRFIPCGQGIQSMSHFKLKSRS